MTRGQWVLEWQGFEGPRERRFAATADAAQAVFDHADAGGYGPVLIEVHRESDGGPFFCVAAGAAWSVATYQESLDPPYFASVGTDASEDQAFSFGGHYSEFPPSALINKAVARAALREFVTTGHCPSVVLWEEV